MRRKEERSKQGQTNRQGKATQHDCKYNKCSCLRWDSNHKHLQRALTCISWKADREPSESPATLPGPRTRGGCESVSGPRSTWPGSRASESAPDTNTAAGCREGRGRRIPYSGGIKLSRKCENRRFRGENFRGSTVGWDACAHIHLKFAEKTFTNGSKSVKFAKVLSLESFPLYCIHYYMYVCTCTTTMHCVLQQNRHTCF